MKDGLLKVPVFNDTGFIGFHQDGLVSRFQRMIGWFQDWTLLSGWFFLGFGLSVSDWILWFFKDLAFSAG